MTHKLAEMVLESMRCGVVTVDRGGRITTLNEPAARWLRVDNVAALGQDCREVFASSPAMAHLLLDAMERGTLPDRAELELEFAGERQVLIGFSLSRITDDAGETIGSAIFFKDLTLVEEERERQALRNRLAGLGEVAAQLAHEIRNRLGGIRLFLGLARRQLEHDPTGEAYLTRAEAEILEANAKMGEILDYVRPLRLDPSLTAIEDLCRAALEATLARYPGHQVETVWQVAPEVPAVQVDATRVRDALANLFANAVEAAGTAGTITIRIRAEQSAVLVSSERTEQLPGLRGYGETSSCRVRVEIEDTGPGIPPDVMRRIFHPFFTTKETGSGLGVPTAQKVFDAHAGSLDVASPEGRGAVFIIRLPAVDIDPCRPGAGATPKGDAA